MADGMSCQHKPRRFPENVWMHVIAPVSTCRSKNAKGEWVEKVYDHVIDCNSLRGNISQMNAVEDDESRPHKAVSFALEKGKGRNGTSKKLPKAGDALHTNTDNIDCPTQTVFFFVFFFFFLSLFLNPKNPTPRNWPKSKLAEVEMAEVDRSGHLQNGKKRQT